jgi:hypothetical protein
MSGYRLHPTPAQQAVLQGHCAHARYIWNLAVEQHSHWHPGRKGAPGYLEQCRQLTAARAEHPWLAAGSQTVQQQALRDFAQATAAFFDPGNQAVFRCTACGFAGNADVNAARNIAAGHPTHLPIPLHSRGGFRDAGPANREPQLLLPSG